MILLNVKIEIRDFGHINLIENISQFVSQIQRIQNNSIFFSILFSLFNIDQFRLHATL